MPQYPYAPGLAQIPNAAYPQFDDGSGVSSTDDITQLLTGLPVGMYGQGSLMEQLAQVQTAGLDEQRAGIQSLENRLAQLKEPKEAKMDLSPLMALHDTWFGGNLAGGYKRPVSPEEINKQEAMLQEAILQAKGKAAGTEAGIIQSKYNALAGLYKSREAAAAQLAAAQERAKHFGAYRGDMDARRAMEKDRQLAERAEKKAERAKEDIQRQRRDISREDDYNVANHLPEAIRPIMELKKNVAANGIEFLGGNATAQDQLNVMFNLVSKDVYGLGALAGPDVGMLERQKGFKGGFGGYINSLITGKNDADFVAALDNLENVLQRKFQKSYGNLERRFPELKNDPALTYLRETMPKKDMPQSAATPQKDGGAQLRAAQLRAELEKRKAAAAVAPQK
jgi:hypothetical protein